MSDALNIDRPTKDERLIISGTGPDDPRWANYKRNLATCPEFAQEVVRTKGKTVTFCTWEQAGALADWAVDTCGVDPDGDTHPISFLDRDDEDEEKREWANQITQAMRRIAHQDAIDFASKALYEIGGELVITHREATNKRSPWKVEAIDRWEAPIPRYPGKGTCRGHGKTLQEALDDCLIKLFRDIMYITDERLSVERGPQNQ